MIELNILKPRLEEYRKRRILLNAFVLYFSIMAFLFAILAMHFIVNRRHVNRIKSEIKAIESSIAEQKERVEYIAMREAQIQRSLKELAVFSSESEKRVLLAPVLSFTAGNVPSGIWLERFSANAPASAGSDSKASLEIQGYVFSSAVNDRQAIDRFVRSMSRGDMFKSVALNYVRRETYGESEVTAFSVNCIFE